MEHLVKGILEGDPRAIKSFYDIYMPKIAKYFSYRLPEGEDIEAFTNDVLLDAVDALPLFKDKSSFSTWLYKIAHNKLVDFYRKKKIKSILISKIPFLNIVAQEVYEPEFQLEKNKIRDNIEDVLRNLSQKYRNILKMHYEEQKSIKEIATALDLSPKAAESLLFRARKKFQETYEAI